MENHEQSRHSYESLSLLSEAYLRDEMKQFVDTLDMTSLMSVAIERMMAYKPGYGATLLDSAPNDLEEVQRFMYQGASDMDLTLEMRLICRLKSGFQALSELRLHHLNCATHKRANGLRLQSPAGLSIHTDPEAKLPSPLLHPIRSELTLAVLKRLENATTVFLNDVYNERMFAFEARFLSTELNMLVHSGPNDLSSIHEISPEQMAAQKAEGDRLRAEFVQKADLEQPQTLRLININASCCCGKVVLEDFQGENYTAISHTYGLDVYEVFNCDCACLCLAQVPRCCSSQVCQHDSAVAAKHSGVIEDILNMCRILQGAGVEFAWHDGVCIAQHDKQEVEETIKCMGWIYAKATETIVFLHYVGTPMAPISNNPKQLVCRWHTRVWTVQEMVLSRSRRYCVRVGDSSLRGCKDLREFEERVGRIWNRVEVITEERFLVMVQEICAVLHPLVHKLTETFTGKDSQMYKKAKEWLNCMLALSLCLIQLGLGFPSRFIDVLRLCSFRDSKHEGDRMNSVLALAGLKDFVAPKDEDLKVWTERFFRMQGQQGLAVALFSVNAFTSWMNIKEQRRHTWAPSLSCIFVDAGNGSWQDWNELEWTVEEESGGNLELTGGPLVCVALRFTLTRESNCSASDQDKPLLPVDALDEKSPAIDMELTRILGYGHYRCSFARAPHYFMGSASLETVVSMPYPYAVVDEGLRRIQEGDSFEAHLVLPLLTITKAFKVMVSSHIPSSSHSPPSDIPSSSHSPPSLSTSAFIPSSSHSPPSLYTLGFNASDPLGLLVQGELPLVSKIGRLLPTNGLLLHLIPMLASASVTILHHLEIK